MLSSTISEVSDNTFNYMNDFKRLKLFYNVTSISSNAFNGLINLEKLDLSGNQIVQLDENAFTSLVKLKCLDLSLIGMPSTV